MADSEDYLDVDRNEKLLEIAEQKDKKMKDAFKRVFTSPEGKIVLEQILIDLGYFRASNDDTENALSNYAKYLLYERLGINDTKEVTAKLLDSIKE